MADETNLETPFRVFDIPTGISALDTERLFNELCGDEMYVAATLPLVRGLRVVVRLSKQAVANRPKPDEDEAIALVRANPWLSLPLMVAALSQHSIRRTKDWVQKQRYMDSHPVELNVDR